MDGVENPIDRGDEVPMESSENISNKKLKNQIKEIINKINSKPHVVQVDSHSIENEQGYCANALLLVRRVP